MANNKDFGSFSMEQAMAFASSPAGRQLIELIGHQSGVDLGKAQSYAAAGDMEQAKAELSSLLNNPKIVELLRQFGG